MKKPKKPLSDTTITYRVLRKKTPAMWVTEINQLQEHIRPSVARIVWWDFFGGRVCAKRVTEFDQWRKHDPTDLSVKELENGLRQVGFCSWTASKRSQGGDLCR